MQNLNKLHLSGLRAIEAIGRLGTLAAAADELLVTPSALSQRLQQAEKVLEQQLFIREPKGLTPTDACRRILPNLTTAMSEMNAAVGLLMPKSETSLTVSLAPIFASRWLVWRIQRFNKLYPEISIRIDPNVTLVDPDMADVDVCIRVGCGPWPNVICEKLLEQRVFPVCSAELADQITSPTDFANVPIIRENDALHGWDVWLASHNLERSVLAKGPTYADASLCLDAAMTGQGVFMAWETLACDALDTGRLVAPFPERIETGAAYWTVVSENSARKRAVKAFMAWLKEELLLSVEHWRE